MSRRGNKYVLVTAAYNEEGYIEKTIQSVVAQTHPPVRWTIVSDGSTDRTDEIVERYAAKHNFIELVRITEKHARNFAAQVFAINLGCKHMQGLEYQFIANVDADVSFPPTYYEQLIAKFDENPALGLAGGFIYEANNGKFESRAMNSVHSVAHAVQMFRRECFESMGGYLALPYGGPDWHAIVLTRMKGWRVEAFPDLPVEHHRPSGTADRIIHSLFRQGRMDYSVGSYPPFEILKIARRFRFKPYVFGSFVRLAGFTWCYCCREKRPVSREFVQFLRREQIEAIRNLFRRVPKDPFSPGEQSPQGAKACLGGNDGRTNSGPNV